MDRLLNSRRLAPEEQVKSLPQWAVKWLECEQPQHSVHITKPFYLSVAVVAWLSFMVIGTAGIIMVLHRLSARKRVPPIIAGWYLLIGVYIARVILNFACFMMPLLSIDCGVGGEASGPAE
jgi:hypothetical protein